MKNKALIILSIILALTSVAVAQDKKSKKKKNKQPQLAVVTIEDAPAPPAPVAQKPANGSLFTDGAANGSLLADFKAAGVGDLVFVDVVETTTATVSSSADRKRDSGTVGGLSTVAGALPISGASAIASGIEALGQ